ncbi:Asp23/Gls24 family envelope stress response protein [Mycolicibacterium sp. CR10]|uniref:Asp23/Gls24 family envelope stress response protein n=1 Tax=Mycolicibacterium sp. CR10 TaxID=2562314 RepID=UPI0010C0A190|nr:Asp23/Gls24 family envelope stress response protein [Mycolicibacterium sp. CR10]
MSPDRANPADLVDGIAEAVSAVDGVAGLHGGMFGEAATYLPGRRVAGIRLDEHGTEVHVSLLFGYPVRPTAEAVRDAVAPLVSGPVHVTVEDVIRSR